MRAELEIPVLHRLAIIYLTLPVAVWLVGWFEWWFGIPAVAALAAGLWKAMLGSWRGRLSPVALAAAMIALGYVMLTAAGGALDLDNWDWHKHRAILTDLGRFSWPVHLPDYLAEYTSAVESPARPLLRYYLGYYMVPGLAAKLLGLGSLSWTVPLWTWFGVSLIALLFIQNLTAKRMGIVVAGAAVVTLFFFGGLDLLWTRALYGWYWPGQEYEKVSQDWFLPINYRSFIHSFSYAPQHFIPAALCGLLLAQGRRQVGFLAVSGVILAASFFWSPFAAIGLMPLATAVLVENGVRPFLRWQNLLLAAPLAGLLLSYMSSGESTARRGWIWELYEWGQIVRWMPLFYLMEFLTLAVLLWLLQPRIRRDVFFIAAVAALLIVPTYHWGYDKSEIMRHASIPALTVLCWYGVKAVVEGGARNGWRIALTGLVAATLFISVVGPLRDRLMHTANEIRDGGIQMFRYDQMLHSTLINLGRSIHGNYSAYDVSFPLESLLRGADDESQAYEYEREELVIQSIYDVYLTHDMLAYVRDACSKEDAAAEFFLRVYPVNTDDIDPDDRQFGFERLTFGFSPLWKGAGGSCVALIPLPGYDIDRIVTGQNGKWEGEHNFE